MRSRAHRAEYVARRSWHLSRRARGGLSYRAMGALQAGAGMGAYARRKLAWHR